MRSSSGRYGADRQLLLMASALDRARYESIVALPGDGPLASDLSDVGVEVLTRPLSVIRRQHLNPAGLARTLAATAGDALALGSLIRRRGIALVHSNTSVVLGGAAAAGLARVPHVWQVREIYSSFARLWPRYRRLLGTASALPCVSEATARQFDGHGPVRVIHEALAFDARREPKSSARASLGLDPAAPVIAVLGRISDWRRQDVLVRALAEPPLTERGAVGLIAGEAWLGAEDRLQAVLQLADELRVAERLSLPSFRDDVNAIYGAADVVALPSTAPDPPGAAIESAAAGCARGGARQAAGDHSRPPYREAGAARRPASACGRRCAAPRRPGRAPPARRRRRGRRPSPVRADATAPLCAGPLRRGAAQAAASTRTGTALKAALPVTRSTTPGSVMSFMLAPG